MVRCEGRPPPEILTATAPLPVALVADVREEPFPGGEPGDAADAEPGDDAVADAGFDARGLAQKWRQPSGSARGRASEASPAAPERDRSDPLRARDPEEVPPVREEPVEPEPEPEPEPEAEADETSWEKFLRTDESMEAEAKPEHPDYIGERDTRPEMPTKAPVIAKESGPRAPRETGVVDAPSPPVLEVDPGPLADPSGQQVETPETLARAAPEDGGGGRDGREQQTGADGSAGDRFEGGAAARSSGGGAGAAGQPDRDGAVVPGAAPVVAEADVAPPDVAPLPDRPLDADLPDWWDPSTVLVAPSPPARPTTTPTPVVASPTDGDGVALAERPGEAADRGGTESVEETEALARESTPPRDGAGREVDTGAVDMVADFRESVGWSGIERDHMRPPARPAGMSYSEGARPASSQAVLLEDVEMGRVSWAEVGETALGEYTEEVYAIVQERWYAQDLDEHDKALGIQGHATVVFRVLRNGRVTEVSLLKSSGHTALDRLALEAVPERLPRFPRKLDLDSVPQKITFTYRNPLIATDEP